MRNRQGAPVAWGAKFDQHGHMLAHAPYMVGHAESLYQDVARAPCEQLHYVKITLLVGPISVFLCRDIRDPISIVPAVYYLLP